MALMRRKPSTRAMKTTGMSARYLRGADFVKREDLTVAVAAVLVRGATAVAHTATKDGEPPPRAIEHSTACHILRQSWGAHQRGAEQPHGWGGIDTHLCVEALEV